MPWARGPTWPCGGRPCGDADVGSLHEVFTPNGAVVPEHPDVIPGVLDTVAAAELLAAARTTCSTP